MHHPAAIVRPLGKPDDDRVDRMPRLQLEPADRIATNDRSLCTLLDPPPELGFDRGRILQPQALDDTGPLPVFE